MLVLSIIIPLIIIACVILLVAMGKQREGGSDQMKNIYVYLVLFATLMMTIGGSVSVFMALADMVSPAPYYQSYEEFRQYGPDYDESKIKDKSEEELRKSYDDMVRNEEAQGKARAVNTLIKSFGWIVIPFPIFIYFQRRLPKKE